MSWENNIRKVVPYVPGEQPVGKVIKLNTNENPYPPSKAVVDALEGMKKEYDQYRKYPDPDAKTLVEALAKAYGVDTNQVFVGVGSDDVLAIAFLTFFAGDKPILFPDITYSFYDVWADLFRIPYETIALREDFTISPDDYKRENGGIIFPNPNAPTSLELDTASVEKIIQANPESIVIVDEAYIDFGGTSVLPFIDKYDNLLVVQTFSKSRSMAGARIGFAIGNPKLIKYMQDVKFSFNSYTMDQNVLRVGVAAVNDSEYFDETRKKIIETREAAVKKLGELGFTGPKSSANFVFMKHESIPASKIFDELKKKNIYVRYFKKPRIDNYLRITIGTPEEMEALYCALDEIIKMN